MRRCCLIGACLGLAFLLGHAAAQEPAADSPTPEFQCFGHLSSLSWCDLEQLYRQSPPGTIHNGYASGKVIYSPCEKHAGMKKHCAEALWKGKHFCAEQGTLINQFCGFKAIHA